MQIQPIVEGYGEIEAVPVLLRRLVNLARTWNVEIGRPIRRRRNQLVRRAEVEKATRLAVLQGSDAILILFDGDRDCPADLGPKVQRWATAVSGGVPCEVVIPYREYEAWFLAAIESLQGLRGIRSDAQPHPSPELPRGAKEELQARMKSGQRYLERTDQPAFSKLFSMDAAQARCQSFRRLTNAFGTLLLATGQQVDRWPPETFAEP